MIPKMPPPPAATLISHFFLNIFLAADINADDRYIAVVAIESHYEPGVGPGASAGANHPVDIQSHIKRLCQDFFCARNITGGSYGIGTAAGNDIGFSSLPAQFVRHRLHLCHHIGSARNHLRLFNSQKPEKKVVAAGIGFI